MARRSMADVVIVGNGVLGLSIAFETAVRAPELRIIVVGMPGRPGAATVAAGAMLNCFAEVTRFTDTHPASRDKFALARVALDAWPGWLDRLAESGESAALRDGYSTGTFLLLGAQSAPGTIRNFDAVLAAARRYGEPHQHVDPRDIQGLDAIPRERPVRALYFEREGAVDARVVLAALEVAAARHGVGAVAGTVAKVVLAGGRACGVELCSGETIAADTVVLAAGSVTQRLIEELPLGMVQPILQGTGFAVEIQRADGTGFGHTVRTPIRSGGCGLHLVPQGGGGEYLGATNIVLFEPPVGPRIGIAQSLLRFAMEQFDRRLAFAWVRRWHYGHRPITLDTFPLIGRSPLPGLLIATGTYRDGFHSSPVIARHLADLIVDIPAESGPCARFAPGRAPIEAMSVETSMDLYVEDFVDTSVEFGLQLPYFLDTEPIAELRRRRAGEVFDRLGKRIALSPEILGAVFDADDNRVKNLAAYLRAAREHYPHRT